MAVHLKIYMFLRMIIILRDINALGWDTGVNSIGGELPWKNLGTSLIMERSLDSY